MLKPVAIAFIVFSAFVFKEPVKGVHENDLESYNLKGLVKSCTEYHHEINDTKFLKIFNPKIKQDINTTFYNREGYRTKMMNSTIDSSGKVIRFSSQNYDAKVRQAEASAGRRIEYDKFGPRTIYNQYGQRDTCYNPDKNGKLKLALVYHYDKNHNVISVEKHDHENIIIGKPVYKTLYRYDKFNNLIEELDLGKKGERVSKKSYRYDSRGNVLLRIDSAVRGIGDSNKSTKPTSNIHITSYAYKFFDKAGNWLQQTTIVNNERSYSTKRKIKYYN